MNQDVKIKIAFWYHTCGMTQDEIARQLGLTRQKVNAVIGSLREEGIVTVSVRGCEREHLDWEHLLEERFGLQQAIITPAYDSEEIAFFKAANAAAQYLEQIIDDGMTIGVSWGQTLAATVAEMRFARKPGCRVIQLMGAQSMDGMSGKSDHIARLLAEKLDCASYTLYAPVLVSDPMTKTLLLREKSIRRSIDAMAECDIGLFGIGMLDTDAPMCRMGYLSEEDIARLNDDGFCCDVAMNPVRRDGTVSGCFLENRIINASPETIRQMKNAVGVASGVNKAAAVRAVLQSGMLNTLIIDSALAAAVIRDMEELQ